MLANPALSVAMAPGLKQAKEKLALAQQEAALRAQLAQLEQTAKRSPDLAASMAPALTVARAQLAALEARGGHTVAELDADPARKAAVSKAEVEAIKAARATLGPAAARAKGKQLLEVCMKGDAAAALQLINAGADLDCVDVEGRSPLMIASCEEALNSVAARLIAAGAKLDLVGRTTDYDSALILACNYKRAATALLLVEAGAALDLVDGGGESALDYADENGLAAVAAAIRARGGLTGAEAAKATAAARAKGEQLLVACMRSDDAAALRLISEGADPDCVGDDGFSPLGIASRCEELDGVAARLIAAGAKLDFADEIGDSALTTACFAKRAATALLLVEAGAALNQVNDNGMSALDYADKDGFVAVSAAIRARGGRKGAEIQGRRR